MDPEQESENSGPASSTKPDIVMDVEQDPKQRPQQPLTTAPIAQDDNAIATVLALESMSNPEHTVSKNWALASSPSDQPLVAPEQDVVMIATNVKTAKEQVGQVDCTAGKASEGAIAGKKEPKELPPAAEERDINMLPAQVNTEPAPMQSPTPMAHESSSPSSNLAASSVHLPPVSCVDSHPQEHQLNVMDALSYLDAVPSWRTLRVSCKWLRILLSVKY